MNDNNFYIHNYALDYDNKKQKKKKKKKILLILLFIFLILILAYLIYELKFNNKFEYKGETNYEEYDPNFDIEDEESNIISNIISNSNVIESNINNDSNSNKSNIITIESNTNSNIIIKDEIKPTISKISFITSTNSIEVTATYSDNVTKKSNLIVLYSKDGKSWQKSNKFTSLKPNTTYKIYVKVIDEASNFIVKNKDVTTKVVPARDNVSGIYTLDGNTIYVAELSDKSIVYSKEITNKESFHLSKLTSNSNGIKKYSSAGISFDNEYLIYNGKNLVRKGNYTKEQVFENYYGGKFLSSTKFNGLYVKDGEPSSTIELISYSKDGKNVSNVIVKNSNGTTNLTLNITNTGIYHYDGSPNHPSSTLSITSDSNNLIVKSSAIYPYTALFSASGNYSLKTKYNLEYIIKNKIVK